MGNVAAAPGASAPADSSLSAQQELGCPVWQGLPAPCPLPLARLQLAQLH